MSASTSRGAEPSNLVTLHREERRHDFFAEHLHDPPFFDATLGTWIIVDPEQIAELLLSPSVAVAGFGSAYERLEAAGRGLYPNIRFAFEHMSLAQNGAAHRDTRRHHAAMIAERRADLAVMVPSLMATVIEPLRQPGEVEIMKSVLAPLVARIMGSLVGIGAEDAGSTGSVSSIFDRMIGPAKRVKIEERMGAVRALIRTHTGAEPGSRDEGLRLGILVTGSDSLLGTLGESLYRILAAHEGACFSDIAWPGVPPETGVPYVERVAAEPIALAGASIAAGDRVRFMLQGLTTTGDPADSARIFGYGGRVCLGRALSLDVWGALVAALARIDLRQQVLRYAPRASDYAFTCPETVLVRVTQ